MTTLFEKAVDYCTSNNIPLPDYKQLSLLGTTVSEKFKLLHPEIKVEKYPLLIGAEEKKVNHYPDFFADEMTIIIRNFLHPKRARKPLIRAAFSGKQLISKP